MSTEKTSIENGNEPSCLGAVICRLSSPTLIKPLDFDGEPLYYKMNGMYGYLMPSGKKVLWFYSDAYGGNKNRLVQFYKRFGFKMNKGIHKNYKYMDLMIRYPKLSEEVKEYIKESVKKILS